MLSHMYVKSAHWLSWRTNTSVDFIFRKINTLTWFSKEQGGTDSAIMREKVERHIQRQVKNGPRASIVLPQLRLLRSCNLCCPWNTQLIPDIFLGATQFTYIQNVLFYFIHCFLFIYSRFLFLFMASTKKLDPLWLYTLR